MLVLSADDVKELLDPEQLVDSLAVAMTDLSSGRASVPARNFAKIRDLGLLAAMPAYIPTQNVLAAKLVLVFHGNASKGLETHQAIVAVFDPETGVPIALMDGPAITSIRTAAGSALATRLCARQNSEVLAIIGTGVQARSHVRAIRGVRNISRVVVAGRTAKHVESFAAEVGATPVGTYEEAVSQADIVCCCTNATQPLIMREWLRPGTHVNAVGFTAGCELPPLVFADALVVVESRAAAFGEFPTGAADLTTALKDAILEAGDVTEVGELVQRRRPSRTNEAQISIYRSVGVAAQDAAAAGLVFQAARLRRRGVEICF